MFYLLNLFYPKTRQVLNCIHHVIPNGKSMGLVLEAQWTVPQLSIMIIYNITWSILIQQISIIVPGDSLT